MFRRGMLAGLRVGLALVLVAAAAWGSGPRYVTGPPFFTGPAGVPVGWRQTQLLYFTDPGDLSTTVNHAAADAIVAAAAGVWNVSVANITVSQGGQLAEHVSGANVYLSNSGMVWPTDVMSSNAGAIPVAVVYDADGSVTDTLLGMGASSPTSCRQNAVTESVDAFDPAGYILHAIVVVNGRCTGAAPEQQLQLQYQLERIFGRILGLAWSQTNDNVFTGVPTPTYDQASHWPIMHPIDVLCGPYSYQCLPNPFQLREDDVAGLVGLYPITSSTPLGAGKQLSLTNANAGWTFVYFADGEGMTGVNLLVAQEPRFSSAENAWSTVSVVTGSLFRRAGTSPFVSADTSALGSMGTTDTNYRGYITFPYIPMFVGDPYPSQDEFISFEPVNPLYIGPQSIGPYSVGMVSTSGSFQENFQWGGVSVGQNPGNSFIVSGGPSACGSGTDGTFSIPVAVATSGWWQGSLCGYGHAAYGWLEVKPGRSLTVEATGLDAGGEATMTKAMPVIALFAASDGAANSPSLGVQESAFNGMGIGTTQLQATPFQTGGAGGMVRVGIADERGDGRPDFSYQARVFYADSVSPTQISSGGTGATLTIVGMGFRGGNRVVVNGVAATVLSWTNNTIIATAPTMAAAGATAGVPVDVEVLDVGTGATTTISGGLTYSGGSPGNTMVLVSEPQSPAFTGSSASPNFAVRVLKADGVTPVVGDTVVFSVASGSAHFSACGAATCSVTTDAGGNASSGVVPIAAGTITVQAVDGSASVSATLSAQTQAGVMVVQSAPSGTLAVGTTASSNFQVAVQSGGGSGLSGQLVTFQVTQGQALLKPCNAAVCGVLTNNSGQAAVAVMPMAAGSLTIVATDGSLTQTISVSASSSPNIYNWLTAPSGTVNVGSSWHIQVQLTQSDGVTGVVGVPLTFSGSVGITFTPCSGNPCTVLTGGGGWVDFYGSASLPGVATITMTSGSVVLTKTFQVNQPTPTLRFVAVPTGNVPVGSAVVVTAQLLDQSGNPWGGQGVVLGTRSDQAASSACGGTGTCTLQTDGNGEVTTDVTPLMAGQIAVSAVFGQVVAGANIQAVGGRETLIVVTPPPATVTVGSTVTMKLLGMSGDGVTPEANRLTAVIVTSGSFSINGCSSGSCQYRLGSDGTLTITGVSWIPGLTTVSVTEDGLIATMSFNVVNPTSRMALLSAPSGNYPSGAPITPNFVVQVLGPDGMTGLSGQNVTFSVTNGAATLGACPRLPCVVQTNSSGIASSGTLGAVGSGAVTLMASDGAMTQTANYGVALKPDLVSLASTPASVSQSATTTQAFGVKVVLSDGVTPAAGVTVTLNALAGTGSALFSVCGGGSCTVVTNSNGIASSTVIGAQVGTVTLSGTATLLTGNQTVTAPLTVVANSMSVSGTPQMVYVAESKVFAGSISLTAVQGQSVASGQAVTWTGMPGYSVGATSGLTNGSGSATVGVTIGPLAAGTQALATGCVWQTVCATYEATGVSANVWAVAVMTGGNQNVTGGAPLAPVVAEVTDGTGRPVAGALVTIGQTVRAYVASCPVQGRCPAAPVLAAGSSTLMSDANGQVAVAPMGIKGTATQTSLEFSAGLQGSATAVVTSTP